MIRAATISAACVLALAACSKPKPPANESDVVPLPPSVAPAATTPDGPTPAAAPAQPTGPAEAVTLADDDSIQWAASVTEVVWLPDLNAKLFSTAGGDPAINGLYTYLAFPPENNDEGWTAYKLGDWESWKVIEQGPGRVLLQVRVSRIDPSSGNPVTEDKKLIVNWTTTGENHTVTVTPAA